MRFRSREHESSRQREARPLPPPLPPKAEPEPEPEPQADPTPAPPPSVERWEYQVRRIAEERQRGLLGWKRLEDMLNAEGADGWELVSIDAESATFKRRLSEPRRQ